MLHILIQSKFMPEFKAAICFFRPKEISVLYQFDGKRPVLGKETYISELATIIGNVRIGDNCYIGHGAILRGDYGQIQIGSESAIEEGVIIHAPPGDRNQIGKRVTIGHGAIVHGKYIGDFAVIGMGAILSIWSEIDEKSIVAEGSVVKMQQKVPPHVVVAGNPAQIVRDVSPKDEEFWSYGKRLYVDLAKKYLNNGMEIISSG